MNYLSPHRVTAVVTGVKYNQPAGKTDGGMRIIVNKGLPEHRLTVGIAVVVEIYGVNSNTPPEYFARYVCAHRNGNKKALLASIDA